MNKKSIFITGAGQGIGKATAKYFAEKGWYIGLSDMNEVTVKAVQQEIGAANSSVHIADVTNKEQLAKAIADFGEITRGKMNVVFNNAGILFPGGFEKVPLEKHHKVFEVNVNGIMNSTFYALPLLKNTPNSCVISMCSLASVYGSPELTAYHASKSAVKSLTEGWSILFKKFGIHVCDILVAFVDTPMVIDELEAMKMSKEEAVKVTPREIAQAVWKAVHSKKMHHLVGSDAKSLTFLKWLLPQSWFEGVLKKTFFKEALDN